MYCLPRYARWLKATTNYCGSSNYLRSTFRATYESMQPNNGRHCFRKALLLKIPEAEQRQKKHGATRAFSFCAKCSTNGILPYWALRHALISRHEDGVRFARKIDTSLFNHPFIDGGRQRRFTSAAPLTSTAYALCKSISESALLLWPCT